MNNNKNGFAHHHLKENGHNHENGNGHGKYSAAELKLLEEIGNSHFLSSYNTPLKPDAFDLSDEEKINLIEGHFRQIMEILGLDLTDDSLNGTPRRVAKMYVKEIFSGLNPANKPSVTLFDNKYQYDEMLIERDITFHSNCEHHFVPITGFAHVAYIPNKKVIGLSKINRLVRYFAKRPQVQERLTVQIANELRNALETEHVAVIIEADHACVATRGVNDVTSSTVTSQFYGKFEHPEVRREFLSLIRGK